MNKFFLLLMILSVSLVVDALDGNKRLVIIQESGKTARQHEVTANKKQAENYLKELCAKATQVPKSVSSDESNTLSFLGKISDSIKIKKVQKYLAEKRNTLEKLEQDAASLKNQNTYSNGNIESEIQNLKKLIEINNTKLQTAQDKAIEEYHIFKEEAKFFEDILNKQVISDTKITKDLERLYVKACKNTDVSINKQAALSRKKEDIEKYIQMESSRMNDLLIEAKSWKNICNKANNNLENIIKQKEIEIAKNQTDIVNALQNVDNRRQSLELDQQRLEFIKSVLL